MPMTAGLPACDARELIHACHSCAPFSGFQRPTPRRRSLHGCRTEGSAMGRLLAVLTLGVFAMPAAYGQNGNNNGARVGKTGFLLNVIAFDRCPRADMAGSNRRAIAVQADY